MIRSAWLYCSNEGHGSQHNAASLAAIQGVQSAMFLHTHNFCIELNEETTFGEAQIITHSYATEVNFCIIQNVQTLVTSE